MKSSVILLLVVVTNLFASFTALAEPFAGHIYYEIRHSKGFVKNVDHTIVSVDLFVKDKKKAIVVEFTKTGKEKFQSLYLFDDEKQTLLTTNPDSKLYGIAKYSSLPHVFVFPDEVKALGNEMTVLNRKLTTKHYKNQATNFSYSAWYSDLTAVPFSLYKIDSQYIIEPNTGRIALVVAREVNKGQFEYYIAKSIDKIVPDAVFEIPKGYTEKK